SSGFSDHLAREPCDGLRDTYLEQRLLRLAPNLRHEVDQKRIVVEHLLEVRDEPIFVDRIARKPSTEVIVNSALADVAQRGHDSLLCALITKADRAAPEQPEDVPLRKLRRARKATMLAVDRARDTRNEVGNRDPRNCLRAIARSLFLQRSDKRFRVLAHVI